MEHLGRIFGRENPQNIKVHRTSGMERRKQETWSKISIHISQLKKDIWVSHPWRCLRQWGREDKRGRGWKGSVSPRTIARTLETQNMKREKSHGNNRRPSGTSSSSLAHGLCICYSLSFYHLLALHRAGSFLSFMSSIKYHFLRDNFLYHSVNSSSNSVALCHITSFLNNT